MCGGGSPGRAKIPTSPQATPSPSSPPTPSGFPVLFCQLYFTATSGVRLFPLQAPLLFPLLTFQKDHIRNTTKSTRFRTGFFWVDSLSVEVGRSRRSTFVWHSTELEPARCAVCALRTGGVCAYSVDVPQSIDCADQKEYAAKTLLHPRLRVAC